MIKIIEFCGGIGAQHMAAIKAFGKKNVISHSYIDWAQKSVNQYNSEFGTIYKRADMQAVRGWHLEIKHNGKDIFIVFASTPCQSLSNEGKHEGMAPGANFQSSLVWEIIRILKECKTLDPINKSRMPHYVVFENVKGMHDKSNKKWFDTLITMLSKLGYDVKFRDLNGKDFGEAQMRNRCFIVCTLKDCGLPDYKFVDIPSKKDAVAQAKLSAMRVVDMNRKIGNTPMSEILETNQAGNNYIIADYSHGTDELYKKAPYVKGLDLNTLTVINRDHCKTQKKLKAYTDRVPTLLTGPKFIKVLDPHNKILRHLTTWEAWNLMDFPRYAYDEAKKTSCQTDLYKTAGDSIMVNVLAKVLEPIPVTAPYTDIYPDVPDRKNGWLFRSKTAVYRQAYKLYNKINNENISAILPDRNGKEIAIFGLETKHRYNSKAAKRKIEKLKDDQRARRNIKSRILNTSAPTQGAFLMPAVSKSNKSVKSYKSIKEPARKQKVVAKRVHKAQVRKTTKYRFLANKKR